MATEKSSSKGSEFSKLEKSLDVPNNEKKSTKPSSRIISLDILRGYAVLAMILIHYSVFMRAETLETTQFSMWVVQTQGSIVLPFFSMIMGAALVLSIDIRISRGASYRDNVIHMVKRLIIFFALDTIRIVSNLIYFGVQILFTEGMFPGRIPHLGIAALICFFLLDIKKIYRISIMIFIEFIWLIGVNPEPYLDPMAIFYMILGTIIGQFILEGRKNGRMGILLKKMLICGIILFSLGIPSVIYTVEVYVTKLYEGTLERRYWLEPSFIIYVLGLFILLFSLLFWFQDYKSSKNKVIRPLQPLTVFGALSLSIWYYHFILLTNFLGPYGWLNKFSVYSFVLFMVIFYMLIYLLGLLWSQSKYKYSLEWVVRKFS